MVGMNQVKMGTTHAVNTSLNSARFKENNMRDIKFRVWTGYQMIKPFTLIDIQNEKASIRNSDFIMQYTGVDDKNGTPIFEGDIVKGICLGFCDDDEFKDVVEWGNGSFCFKKEKWKDGTYDWYSLENYNSGDLEVVGNIYENPDMLKVL